LLIFFRPNLLDFSNEGVTVGPAAFSLECG